MTKLYVKNLESDCTKQSVRMLFEPFGSVERIRMNATPNGARPRFAFVEMTEAPAAARAIEALHGSSRGPQTLHVITARPTRSFPKLGAD